MFLLAPITFAALLLVYSGAWRIHQSWRRSESWDEIVARLKPGDWSSTKGLWATYRNASVLLELADYAAENGDGQDLSEELLDSLRADAFRMRIEALAALMQHLFAIPQSSPGSSSAS